MELVVEILFEIYGELMFLIVPEKNRSKRYIRIAKVIAVFAFLSVLALAIWGGVLIWECGNLWGTVPLALAVILSLIQIIAGFAPYKKNH